MGENDLFDKITGLDEAAMVERVRRYVDLEDKPSYICVFCGADDNRYIRFCDRVSKELNIAAESIVEFEYNRLGSKLYQLQTDTHFSSDILMAKIKGIEHTHFNGPQGFSQQLRQNYMAGLREKQPSHPKTIVVMTQINPAAGRELYDYMLADALNARFRNMAVELAEK